MFTYEFDPDTGGLLLKDDIQIFSKEPRPVYAQEMDFLGMDTIWNYEKQQELPYLWAESNAYWYRGEMIAKAVGGSLYETPELQMCQKEVVSESGDKTKQQTLPNNTTMIPVNIVEMIEKNKEILDIITQMTSKMIYQYYIKQKKKMDCFHVAFSGGKDSIVLLDLVKKALHPSAFIVVFGDTGMEFPDTYEVINKVEKDCQQDGIEFYRASSHLDPMESWKLFGPPSRVLRWCCSVHKASPQTLKLREVLEKSDFIGADFVGVRRDESVKRSSYEYENYGKKQKGQYSHNSILDWNSAEIWLYLYTHNLPINDAYKKGNSRAGCLLCPMGGGKGDFFQYKSYSNEISEYINSIHSTNARDAGNMDRLRSYVSNGGWNARKNGRDLTISELRYCEETKNGRIKLTITNPLSNWKEWIKTIDTSSMNYRVTETKNGYVVSVSEKEFSEIPSNKKKFKQVFKKAAYCVNCKTCESHCNHHCLSFEDGVQINDCKKCGQCHEVDSGCLVYHSLRLPTGEGANKKMKSINSFGNHAPKPQWIVDFLAKGTDFWEHNSLGGPQIDSFKRFLRACNLMEEKKLETTALYEIFTQKGIEDKSVWGLIFSNLAYNAQCSWFIKNLKINQEYSRDIVAEMLLNDGVTKGNISSITGSWKRFCELPLGTTLNIGNFTLKGVSVATMTRTKCFVSDHRVVLYSLYKFAEACEGYYQFSLTRLLNHDIDSAGLSPTEIFGLSRDDMEGFLNGLTVKYPEFINSTFTHDLDKISLSEDKTSADVLTLF